MATIDLAWAAIATLVPALQHPAAHGPAHWHYDPYAVQLGSLHIPGRGAAHDDAIAAVEALPSGDVLVAGSTYGSLGEAHAGSISTTDAFLARLDAAGNVLWLRQMGALTGPTIPALDGNPSGPGGDAAGSEEANGIAVAADGSIFVCGNTTGSLGETNAGASDVFLAKFDAGGALQWLRQLGSETAATLVPEPRATLYRDASNFEVGRSIALAPDGGVLVGGLTGSNLTEACSTFQDFVLFRYDAAGQLAWVRQMGSTSAPQIGYALQPYDEFSQAVFDPAGRIVLAGTAWGVVGTLYVQRPVLMTFAASGVPLQWATMSVFTTSFSAVRVHAPSGRILVAGAQRTADKYHDQADLFAACFDGSLQLQWATVLDSTAAAELGLGDVANSQEAVADLRLDALGNLVLAGTTNGSLDEPLGGGTADLFTARIRGTDGRVLSVSQLGLATASLGFDTSAVDRVGANGLALGPAGTILLGGSTTGSFGEPSAGGTDALLLRLSPQGKLR